MKTGTPHLFGWVAIRQAGKLCPEIVHNLLDGNEQLANPSVIPFPLQSYRVAFLFLTGLGCQLCR